MLIKTLAIGIIFLFIGVAVTPSTAVTIPNKEDATLVDDTSEDGCDCQIVDKINLNRLKRALDKLDDYSRILQLLLKQYPEISEEFEGVSDKISTLTKMNDELKTVNAPQYYPIICNITFLIMTSSFLLMEFFGTIAMNNPENPILSILSYLMAQPFALIFMISLLILGRLDCI